MEILTCFRLSCITSKTNGMTFHLLKKNCRSVFTLYGWISTLCFLSDTVSNPSFYPSIIWYLFSWSWLHSFCNHLIHARGCGNPWLFILRLICSVDVVNVGVLSEIDPIFYAYYIWTYILCILYLDFVLQPSYCTL